MAIYSRDGTELNSIYSRTGTSLAVAYNRNGQEIFRSGGGSEDYDEWTTEYQHTILQARDEWKTNYRADDDIVPILIDTDQHRNYNKANIRDLFNYLNLAIKWDEVSAHINLGDVCGAKYNTLDLNNMLSCLNQIPSTKQINIAGNHDVADSPPEGSTSSYGTIDDATFTYMQNTYFNNANYNGGNYDHRYGNRGNEYIIDEAHKIKYCVFTTWYYDVPTAYSNPLMTTEAVNAWIDMLSSVDDYDIIILSHIQPYYYNKWYHPAVDGGEWRIAETTLDTINKVTPRTQLNQMIADRKTKSSGSIVDCYGVTHNYDFSDCTSDILCWFSGHWHSDWYQWDANGTVPAISLDALGYDYHPFFMINVDRTNQLVDIWQVDDSPTFYNFQIPFNKQPENPVTGISLSPTTLTIAVDESYTLTPTISTQYGNDPSYPKWVPSWSVRVRSTLSQAIASCSNGVVTGKSAGNCTVYVQCEGFTASCDVTVTES